MSQRISIVSQWPLSTLPFNLSFFSHLIEADAAYHLVLSSSFFFWAFDWDTSQKYAILVPAGVIFPLKCCSIGWYYGVVMSGSETAGPHVGAVDRVELDLGHLGVEPGVGGDT